ncbi:MAG: restriction endonuclease subunit S [Candidatus Tritonobacter lacicola]|nr:restriction endonuclease subunit S [Candidatus Tritonobacter lacicola]
MPKGEALSVHPNEHPYIRVRDITDGGIDREALLYVPESIFEKISRYTVDEGNIIITIVGTVGLVAEIPASLHKASLTENAAKLIVSNHDKLHSSYLNWFLTSRQGQHEIAINTVGSTQPKLPIYGLANIATPLPPLPEQKAIAHILGSLDDKIELNRRMNATLEGMAQALFKSWFVDFDPVLDNALSAGNPIPEELAARAELRRQALADGTANRETAKQFPAAFQITEEMGWIPVGWESQALYNIANFINGASYKAKDFTDAPGALPVIKIAEVKNGVSGQTKFTNINKGEKYRINNGEILLSWSGNPDTSIDTFIWTNDEGYLNQHIFKVSLHQETDKYFVYYQLKSLRSDFAEIARDKQTTGLGHFTVGDMKRFQVINPTQELLVFFNEAVTSLYKRSYDNRISKKTLTKLRDTLLPKLISGELQIPEAEKLAEEALA